VVFNPFDISALVLIEGDLMPWVRIIIVFFLLMKILFLYMKTFSPYFKLS